MDGDHDTRTATTTSEEDRASAGARQAEADLATRASEASILRTAGQRSVNIFWERTQAGIAIGTTAVFLYCAVCGIESKTLEAGWIAIVSMYFTRTNHKKTGGVELDDTGR